MLVLTQLSVGAFVVEFLARRLFPQLASDGLTRARAYHAIVALGAGLLALGASVFHLGRPKYAFRAFIGLRTSWLSREILAFGAFAGAAAAYAAHVWSGPLLAKLHLPPLPGWLGTTAASDALGALVVGSGIAGVGCSVMLYVKTAREWWSGARTAFRFYATAAVLGLATTLVTLLAFGCGPGGGGLRGRRPGRAPAGDRLRRQARLGDVDPPASGRQAARVAEAHGVAAAGRPRGMKRARASRSASWAVCSRRSRSRTSPTRATGRWPP